ncbi:MAG: malonyl-CoA decarboxylase [Gammaproteobacteria bacterium]|nr:malonyl-CoA decarboxylase [Gammaproteobacteria bacterium]
MANGQESAESFTGEDNARLRRQFDACLAAAGGEVSARAQAAELGGIYMSLDASGRRQFLEVLAGDYGTDQGEVDAAIASVQQAQDADTRTLAERKLRKCLVPARVSLLTRFNELNLGVKFLVNLRADLLSMIAAEPAGADKLRALDGDLKDLLVSWFDIGLLELKQITWETPAALLEKLIEYEAVHAIRSWVDLKNRLQADRRCYAFFHPSMPDEPLIFVQVALVNGISGDIHPLLDETLPIGEPQTADTAIFYSISNCQRGLAGVSFGNFLIKRVAGDLTRELPKLKVFSTLSPIPGFGGWLAQEEGATASPSEREQVFLALGEDPSGESAQHEPLAALIERATADREWVDNAALVAALEPILMRLCAQYLVSARRRGHQARDPVAHFHLSNGARIERLNWMADRSKRGLKQSAGMMVNYRYVLADVDKNHEAYAGNGTVRAVPAVRKLTKG